MNVRRFSPCRSKPAKVCSFALVLLPLLLVCWSYSDYVRMLPPSWMLPCTTLTYDANLSASTDGFVRAAGASTRRPLPDALNLSFPGFTVSCTDDSPWVEEPDMVAAVEGDEADPRRRLVEVTYRICCSIGKRPRTVCKTAARPLLIPAPAAAAVRSSGDRAAPSSHLALLDLDRALVFVTGSSADHFEESLVLVSGIQRHFRCARIVYWDLGLSAEQADRVRSFCGVAYKRFDFSKYPPHVRMLKTYAFKPLAIMETFDEYRALWWVDASIRFRSEHVEHILALAKERHGLVLFREPDHSVWSTTYEQTYGYIATDEEGLKRTVTATGASFVVVNTRELHSTVLRWFYACALDARCIAPIAHPEPCDLRGPGDFANCHRFDQSVLTMLVANVWGFGSDGYRYEQDAFRITRSTAGSGYVRRCQETAGGGGGSSSPIDGPT